MERDRLFNEGITPNLEKEVGYIDRDKDTREQEIRREYKYALLEPYFEVLPWSVIDVMLDHDLITKDEYGNTIPSMYYYARMSGEVERKIMEQEMKDMGNDSHDEFTTDIIDL